MPLLGLGPYSGALGGPPLAGGPKRNAIKEFAEFEVGVEVDWSVSGNQTMTATTDSQYTPSSLVLASAMSCTVSSSNVGAGSWTATYQGPSAPSGGLVVSGPGAKTTMKLTARLVRWKLYLTYEPVSGLNFFRSMCDQIDIYLDGAFLLTLGGFDTGKSLLVAPSYVYPFNGLVKVSGNPSVVDPGSGGHTVSNFTVSGGYRWKETGSTTWATSVVTVPPITIEASTTLANIPPIPGSHPAPFGLHLTDSVLSTSSWGTQLYLADDWQRDTGTGTDRTTYGGYVWLFPDNARAFKRFSTDNRTTLKRWAFPSATAVSARQGVKNSGPSGTSAATTTLASYYGATSAEVLGTAGSIEAPMSDHAYAWCVVSAHKETSIGTGGIVNEEDLTFTYASTVSAAGMASYLSHLEDVVNYFNTVVNPHWSFARETGPWDVDGSPETWPAYWSVLRQQHNSLSDARNHIVADPCDNSQTTPTQDSSLGNRRWLGVSRFTSRPATMRASYTYTDSTPSLWSGTDCSLLHLAPYVTVSPSAVTCQVRMKLGSFLVEPYMFPHLCDQITADWETTNVSDLKVYLEGRNGETVLLNDNQPGVAKTRPESTTSKYCGSWVQDFGADGVTDQGADQDAGGDSLSVFNDSEGVYAARGLADRTAEYLVFEITPADPGSTVNIYYPQIAYTLAASRVQKVENAGDQVVVHPAGPGVRFGDWSFLAGSVSPPFVQGDTGKMSLVDGLCSIRLTAEGIAFNDGLSTEIGSLFDSYGRNTLAGADQYSLSFLLPEGDGTWRVGLVDSMAECPPLAGFPRKARDLTTWEETGSYALESWLWDDGYCTSVASRVAGHVKDGGGTQWSSASGSVDGWYFARHDHALTDSETGFGIYQGTNQRGKDWRPWRGFFAVWPPLAEALGVDSCRTRDGRHFRVWIKSDNTVVTDYTDATRAWNTLDQAFSADAVSISHMPNARGNSVFLLYADGGTVYERSSADGVTWSVATTVGSGTQCKGGPALGDGRRLRYRRDTDTKIYADIVDAGGNVIQSGYDTGISGVDDASFGYHCYPYGANRVKFVIECVVSGTVTEYTSDNGLDYS